ncbi:MAG: carboxypeptidase regulatory-like domain-containing protein, partial [Mucilaginibacter sp.]|nr:carboxypeptidase regulatory-like domain-containing protein [Mucilaginibacter sp.]
SPGYYINRTDKQAWQTLDNLMLTQGWTGYDWQDVFAPAKQPKFEAEKDFKITGRVTNLFNKPVKSGFSVLISSQKPTFTTTTYTDEDGRYLFKKLPTIDSGSFFLQAKNAKGKSMTFGNVSVDKFKAPAVPETLRDPILPWYVNSDTTQINYVKRTAERNNEKNIKLNGIVLKEVKIKSKKIIKDSFNRNGPGNADLSFDEQDIKESAVLNLYQLLKQKLPGLKIVEEHRMPTLKLNNAIVVIHIDGGGLDIFMGANPTVEELEDELSQYQIATFKGMEVYYSEKNMVNYLEPRNWWIDAHFTGEQIAASEAALIGGKWFDDEQHPWGLDPTAIDRIAKGWVYKVGYKPGYLESRANILTNKTPDFASIDITTKNGNGWFKNKAPSAVTYRPLPVMYPQQFYSPKYNVAPGATTLLDYRSTLYWVPNIVTDQNGKAKVSFYTSDIMGKYTIKIAGIDASGGIGDGTFKVKSK